MKLFSLLSLCLPLLTSPLPLHADQKLFINAQMKNKISSFNEAALTAKAGEDVEIEIQNDSTEPKEYRNWVLSQPGSEAAVMTSAMDAGTSNHWTPTSDKVIAKSKLIAPGESETVHFTAPLTPGEYPYFCTYPGHFMTMKGKLIVKTGAATKAVK